MSADIQAKLRQLEQLLAELKRERQLTREQWDVPQRNPRRFVRWPTLAGLVLAALLAGMGLLATTTSEAQSPAKKTHTVQAPFHVVDKAGNVLFSVSDTHTGVRGLFTASDKSGKPVLAVDGDGKGTTDKGPLRRGISVADTSGRVVTFLGVGDGDCGTLETFESGGERVVGLDKVGVKVYGKGPKPIARLGRNADTGDQGFLGIGKEGVALVGIGIKDEVGFVELGGKDQKNVVELGKAGVQVINKDSQVVGRLGVSSGNAGYFALSTPSGDAVVEGGMLPDKRGVIKAYPYKPKVGEFLTGHNLIIGSSAE